MSHIRTLRQNESVGLSRPQVTSPGDVKNPGNKMFAICRSYSGRKNVDLYCTFNPRPTGTPDFPPPTGGRGVRTPASISAPIGRRVKRKKRSKTRQKLLRNLAVNFSLSSKLWSQGQKMSKFSNCSQLSNIASQNLHYVGNYYS